MSADRPGPQQWGPGPPVTAPVRLRRGLGARLFGGAVFQGLLTLFAAVDVVSIAAAAHQGILGTAPWVFLVQIPYLAVWLLGVTAWACVDADGVRWRYFVRHTLTWAQIQEVRLDEARRPTGSSNSPGLRTHATVRLVVDGRSVHVVPAVVVADPYLQQFGAALRWFADQRGVPCRVTSRDWTWDPLRVRPDDAPRR